MAIAPTIWQNTTMRTALGIFIIGLLLFGSTRILKGIDSTKPEDWFQDQFTYLPSGKFLKPMVLDFDEAAGSLLIVKGMTYFADAYFLEKGYAWLGHILDVATTLNPRMESVYEFAGVILTRDKEQIPTAMGILERGVYEFPEAWRLRLYLALAQVKLDSNYLKASEYLEPVLTQPNVPTHIKTLAASFRNKGGDRRMALAFLVDNYKSNTNPMHGEILIERIIKLYQEDNPPKDRQRQLIEKILTEVKAEPRSEMMGLGLIHQYLSGTLSPQGSRLFEALGIQIPPDTENPPK